MGPAPARNTQASDGSSSSSSRRDPWPSDLELLVIATIVMEKLAKVIQESQGGL